MARKIYNIMAAVCLATSTVTVPGQADSPVKIGELNCQVSDYENRFLTTEIVLDCAYIDSEGNDAGVYRGTIDRVGLDIGNIRTERFTWIVGTLGDPSDADIGGTYIGATAGASAGVGAAGNYLTGGFEGKISLQPLSAEKKFGFGVSLAGQKLVLEKVDG